MTMRRTIGATAALLLTLPGTAVANVTQCLACHSVDEGAAHKAGPNLHQICGKPYGSATGYTYSKALRETRGHWNHAEIIALIANTREAIPGSRMMMPPVRDEARQQQIVADLEARIGCTFAK